ncbi:DUF1801 domain-containing protein [Flavobacterium sp. AED]|uniref:DUF1801 domain-containing protein n=1 Tax=Flavobacterium sp. AED TaxID=1423323 RepID=UPI00057D8D6B|nr:DUF1801 domain-containing protein [Flavobacterium sp. AED]KIA85196.1 hypothetical protein OA85_12380 [Flavobacterium sp. AED]MDI1306937.1 DUF1801 domain-containing protein [bacterium]
MGNTQGIQFNTIEEFLDYLTEDEREIVLFLRKIILECIPNCKEKLAYNVPFYYRHSRICYIWPASIPWGKVEQGVAIGFCKGTSFLDETFETTKFTSKVTFTSVAAIDVAFLRQQIYEAVLIDEQIVKAKRRKIQ